MQSKQETQLIEDLLYFEEQINIDLNRDVLNNLIDEDMFQTCSYNDEEEGYDITERVQKLYDTVDELCNLIEKHGVGFIHQYTIVRKVVLYIEHLKKEEIDEYNLTELLKEIKQYTTKYSSDYLQSLLQD